MPELVFRGGVVARLERARRHPGSPADPAAGFGETDAALGLVSMTLNATPVAASAQHSRDEETPNCRWFSRVGR